MFQTTRFPINDVVRRMGWGSINRRKLSWVGHTLRIPADDIAHQTLDWNTQGTRRGRSTQEYVVKSYR